MMAPLALLLAVTASAQVLTLDDALNDARKNNLDLQISRARLDQSLENSRKAWAAYLPRISVGGNYTRNSNEARIGLPSGYLVRETGVLAAEPEGPPVRGTPTTLAVVPAGFSEVVIQPFNQLSAQAQVDQALLSPSLWGAIRVANTSEKVASLNNEATRREVLFGVARAFHSAAGLQVALSANERLLEAREAHAKDAQLRYEAGSVPKVALLRAQLDRTQAESQVTRARNALGSAKLALATLLQRSPDFELALPEEAPAPAGELNWEHRPEVAGAREALVLAERQRTQVWLSYLPSVGLSGLYRASNVAGFAGASNIWAVSLNAQWLLWDGGLREAQLRESGARVVESSAQAKLTESRAREELARADLDYQDAQVAVAQAQEALVLARETERITHESFKVGGATYLEVADATAALSNAEMGFISERVRVSLAALSLQRAAGTFALE